MGHMTWCFWSIKSYTTRQISVKFQKEDMSNFAVSYNISLSSLYRLVWKHWKHTMLIRYILLSVCLRLIPFQQLSLIQYMEFTTMQCCIKMGCDKHQRQIILCTHKRHSTTNPHGWFMWYLLWVLQRKFTLLYLDWTKFQTFGNHSKFWNQLHIYCFFFFLSDLI